MIATYFFPMIGTMLDWETLSGDPNDPVGPAFPYAEATAWGSYRVQTLGLDLDAGTVNVEVEAEEAFHGALKAWMLGRDAARILRGKPRLMRAPGAPRTPLSPQFGRD